MRRDNENRKTRADQQTETDRQTDGQTKTDIHMDRERSRRTRQEGEILMKETKCERRKPEREKRKKKKNTPVIQLSSV